MIKNIIFDLGNVILNDKPSIVLSKIKINSEECKLIENEFFSNWNELDLGNITLEEHLQNSNIPNVLKEKFKEILTKYYKHRNFNVEVINLINELKNNGYKIYVLSNNNKQAYEYLIELPMLKNVDGWIVSCDYHIMKPDSRLYKILFHKYNLIPEESFFIDDKKENIEKAKILGMNGHILDYKKDGVDELIKDMKRNNIKC